MTIGRRRWIRALLAGVIALCLAAPFNAGRATAAPAGCAGCHVGLDWNVADGGGWGEGWAGSYVINTPSSSKVAFCMEPEKSYPNRPVNFTHAGSTADTWDAQRIGYLMWRYGDSNANNAAATAMLVHKFFAPSLGDMMWNSFPGLQGLANQLWSESNENTGPYSFRPGVKRVAPSWDNDLTFEVDFTVQGGAGQNLGFDVPTSWVQNINNFNVKNVSVSKRANSVFTVKGQVDDPAEAWRTGARLVNTVNGVDRWTPIGAGDVQDLLSPMFRPASDPTNVGGPPVKYRPQIASVTQDVLVDAGSELADTIRVWDGRVDDPFNGKSTLYGPYASNAEAQSVAFSDDKIVGAVEFSGTYDNDKQASLTTSALKVESPGFYVWREELFETQKAVAVGQADGGRATETSAVLVPQITSRISSQRIVPNDAGVFTSGDSVVVSGLTPAVGDKPVS